MHFDEEYVVQLRPFPGPSSPAFEAAWRDLERRSLSRNPFLSPSFLIPQTQLPGCAPQALLLTIMDGQGRWLLAGVFEKVSSSRQLPLPHLQAVRTCHSFETGLLVDATACEGVAEVLWRFLRELNLHGISFPMFSVGSSLSRLLMERCEQERSSVIIDDLQTRALTSTNEPRSDLAMSSKRAKSLRRGRRALEKLGHVSFTFSGCPDGDLSAVERFLFLESLGWKGESQTALACRLSEVQAIKDMSFGLAQQNRIRFAELAIDQQVIASMCLLRSESDYYAFKIGWDPQFERGCPGFLLAAEIQDHLHQLPGCERIDSCASPGSFLEHVWPGRKKIGTALFTTTWLGSIAARSTRVARDIYRQLRGRERSPVALDDSTETATEPFPELAGERR